MTFSEDLASTDPRIIKEALITLLNKHISPDVLEMHRQFTAAQDKHEFLSQFEADESLSLTEDSEAYVAAATRSAQFERWTHYIWIRLEIMQLANQKSALNHMLLLKKETKNTTVFVPSFDSVNSAIQQDALNEVPIKKSIAVLKKIRLQIVGTEHPTDPLSQEARNKLTEIANAMDQEDPHEQGVEKLLMGLIESDAIPPARRTVTEEVNRNIKITLDKLYDNVPRLTQEILDAYKRHYGQAIYLEHEEDILGAVKQIYCDASWPGFDADGNENVTPDAMHDASRLYRIRVCEKHSKALEASVGKSAERIRQTLRMKLNKLYTELFRATRSMTELEAEDIVNQIEEYREIAVNFIDQRRFFDLKMHYDVVAEYLKQQPINQVIKEQLLDIITQLVTTLNELIEITQFSGLCRRDDVETRGSIEEFQKIFPSYKEQILLSTDKITIKNGRPEGVPATTFVIEEYRDVMERHRALLNKYPELNIQVRNFEMQLHAFGMTYGKGHIRQDSSIFDRVWQMLFADLIADSDFSQCEFLLPLRGRDYDHLTEEECIAFHKYLQSSSVEAKAILNKIKNKYKNADYVADPKYVWVASELKRLKLALEHDDIFEKVIISNCESAADILGVESLCAIANLLLEPVKTSKLTIVPLLEKPEDLKNYEIILVNYIKTKIQHSLESVFDQPDKKELLKKILGIDQRQHIRLFLESKNRNEFSDFLESHAELRPYLKNIIIEIMVGYSDTERVGGLAALIRVKQVQEHFTHLIRDFGVKPSIYHGAGGDLPRGGEKHHDMIGTLQGNARTVLNTDTSTLWFRENQFYQAYKMLSDSSNCFEMTDMPSEMKQWLEMCVTYGMSFYEQLHDSNVGLGKLLSCMLGRTEHWIVTILNSSSRASQRGGHDNPGDRTASVQTNGNSPASHVDINNSRAITAVQMKEMLRGYLDCIGPCYGFRRIGLDKSVWLFNGSETCRDMIIKVSMVAELRDPSFNAYALFGDCVEFIPKDDSEKIAWASECEKEYPGILQNISDMNAMKKHPDLLKMLSRLCAYLDVEWDKTKRFLAELNQALYPNETHTTLLSHYPLLEAQTKEVKDEVSVLNYILSRQSRYIAMNKKLDQIYLGANTQYIPNSKLTGVGRIVANIGAGITVARKMLPGFVENTFLDCRENLRQGSLRAMHAASEIGSTVTLNKPPLQTEKKSVYRFFDTLERKKELDNMLVRMRQSRTGLV